MNWQQVLEDKSLQNLQYKIELNAAGQIVMSPARNKHANFQGEIEHLLRGLAPEGRVFPECAVMTSDNVKVADVVWISPGRFAKVKDEDVYSIAPEICVEVKSPSNSIPGIDAKVKLYLGAQAVEAWMCGEDGAVRFFDASGELAQSKLVPRFPKKINL
jgi:Uma2 family endonuclease